MRYRLLIPILFAALLSASGAYATHTLQYYVYYETDYIQGPWTGARTLDRLEPRYLSPVLYSDLFGTMRTEFAMKVIDRLSADKPEVYNWPFDIDINADTVILKSRRDIVFTETMLNELTSSFTSNGFKCVALRSMSADRTWTADSIRLPMLAVMLPEAAVEITRPETEIGRGVTRRTLLILSLALNVLLIIGIGYAVSKRR